MNFIKTNLLAEITKEGKKNSILDFRGIKIMAMGFDDKGYIDTIVGLDDHGGLSTYKGNELEDIFENYNFTERS